MIIKEFKLFESSLASEQTEFLNKCVRGTWKLNPSTGEVDVDGDFVGSKEFTDFREVKFGGVSGNFVCKGMNLTSLEGSPNITSGNFDCSNNSLRTLKGICPVVRGNLDCSKNLLRDISDIGSFGGSLDINGNRLKSLYGLPDEIDGDFDCGANPLESLQYSPKKIKGQFICVGTGIKNLVGGPEEVGESYLCSKNPELKSLEGAPRKIMESFSCKESPVESLEGGPDWVGKAYYCQNTKIQTLKGAASYVGGPFNCSSCEIYSLEGSPKSIGGSFNCSSNYLPDLIGGPREILAGDKAASSSIDYSNNQLVSLIGLHKKTDISKIDLSGNRASKEALIRVYDLMIKGKSYTLAFIETMDSMEEKDWRLMGMAPLKRFTKDNAIINVCNQEFGHDIDFKTADILKKEHPEVYKILQGEHQTIDTAASLGDLGF